MPTHTILVVDDEPASVRAIARTLGDAHRVLTATAAADALAVLAGESVALMVVDQRMPDMSGTELLARSMITHPDAIRILFTGYTGIETLVEAINAGHVYYYLTKPWEPRELCLVVQRGLEHYDVAAERRRLVRELEAACARWQREADQKSRLLTVAAHEFGTPVHVLANSLALVDDDAVAPTARQWLDAARRSVDWLGRCLAQLRTGARWRTSQLPLQLGAVVVRSVLDALESAYAAVTVQRRLTLQFETAVGLPTIRADPLWLERALSNLISNAIRFTPDGGRIVVAAASVVGAVQIAVTDSGIGIDPRLLPELFEPFSAAGGEVLLHGSGRLEFGARGLGLGLAITKAIIEQHGGSVAVQTRLGSGSQFTVTLPLQPV